MREQWWTSRQWQLRLMSRMRWLRRVMPRWHQREQQFRNWYEQLVDQLVSSPDGESARRQRWLAVLRAPESVTGFRETAYPKMAAARRLAEELLASVPTEEAPAEAPGPAVRSRDR